jgi:hypothetical protein
MNKLIIATALFVMSCVVYITASTLKGLSPENIRKAMPTTFER